MIQTGNRGILFLMAGVLLAAFPLAAQPEEIFPPRFSHPGGICFEPFALVISCDTPGAILRYTTDGSVPGAGRGAEYRSPLQVEGTAVFRAVALTPGGLASEVVTCSYLFPEEVIASRGIPPGYPATWGRYTSLSGNSVADYEMDPDIVGHTDYRNLMVPALVSVPSLSVVTPRGFLFSPVNHPDTGGIYIYTGANGGTGDNWERPASVEFIDPEEGVLFRADCGLQLQGGAGRLPEKNPKHSFRISFRTQYGPDKLKYDLFGEGAATRFNGLVLRGTFCNTWRHWDPKQRTRATHLTDLWAKDTQLAMGYVSAHSRFFHLYLNGLYWGLYNFSERIDDDFMESYFGGDKLEYDIIKDYAELMDGSMAAWDQLWTAVRGNIADNRTYQQLIGNNPDGTPNPTFPALVDPVNLCDYMLINFYAGNTDWDHHNWVAGRNRVNPGKGFAFFCWDSEKIFESAGENNVRENNDNRPSGIFTRMMANKEFRLLFADRAMLHLTNGGLLTEGPVVGRYLKRAAEIDTAMIAESARWGDYRRDVHPYSSGPYALYTRKEHWLKENERLLSGYFPVRTQTVLNQLSAAGMLPAVSPPVFSQHGGEVEKGYGLSMTASAGMVYYTVDGSDPRRTGGSVSPSAIRYSGAVPLTRDTEVRARVISGNDWSALTVAAFRMGVVQPAASLAAAQQGSLAVYPNPAGAQLYVRYHLPAAGRTHLSVAGMDGRIVSRIDLGVRGSGENLFLWQREGIPAGFYILNLTAGEYRARCKIVLQD